MKSAVGGFGNLPGVRRIVLEPLSRLLLKLSLEATSTAATDTLSRRCHAIFLIREYPPSRATHHGTVPFLVDNFRRDVITAPNELLQRNQESPRLQFSMPTSMQRKSLPTVRNIRNREPNGKVLTPVCRPPYGASLHCHFEDPAARTGYWRNTTAWQRAEAGGPDRANGCGHLLLGMGLQEPDSMAVLGVTTYRYCGAKFQ